MQGKTENREVIFSFKKHSSRKKKDDGYMTLAIILIGLIFFISVALIANKSIILSPSYYLKKSLTLWLIS
jgi:hypothetical protein